MQTSFVYDRHNAINIHVAEVKVSEEPSIEFEHNEQMLGLWKSSQKVMRGFEAYNFNVRPTILVLQKNVFAHVIHEGNRLERPKT